VKDQRAEPSPAQQKAPDQHYLDEEDATTELPIGQGIEEKARYDPGHSDRSCNLQCSIDRPETPVDVVEIKDVEYNDIEYDGYEACAGMIGEDINIMAKAD